MAELVIGYLEILVAVACFLLFYVWREDSKGFPRNYPIVGMLPGFLYYRNQAHQRVTNSMRLSGGTFLYKGPWFANMDMLATVDPANVHHVMSANFMNFPKGPKFKEMFEVLGEGIFNADLEMWRVQRKIARGFMMHARFHRFLLETSRVKVEQGLIPVLEHYVVAAENQGGSAVMDLQDLFQRYTFDTSCILITGYDPGCVSVDFSEVPFSKAMDDAEEAILVRHIMPECIWKLQRWVGVGSEKKLTQASNTLDQVIAGYIAKKRQELNHQEEDPDDKEETIRGCDLLTSYLRHQQSDQDTMGLNLKLDDQKFLRDTIMNLMIAGRDTTSSALTWFIWLVSTHPHVESKIREELTKTLIPKDQSQKWRVFNAEELKPLVYLHASICESLRLYPPVPFQHKEPVHTDTLPSGHTVHPKMKIMIPLYAMGRMESIWGEDAAEFKPERWISEKGTVKHEPSYKFMAFNAGPRTCLGKEIAFTQIKPVAASIIHNYQVKVVEGHPVEPNSSIILYMRHGFKVRLHRRSMLN